MLRPVGGKDWHPHALRGNDIARRVCIHREVDQVVEQCQPGITRPMLKALAQHVSESDGESVEVQRAMLLTLAGYAQAVVEHIDREAAR